MQSQTQKRTNWTKFLFRKSIAFAAYHQRLHTRNKSRRTENPSRRHKNLSEIQSANCIWARTPAFWHMSGGISISKPGSHSSEFKRFQFLARKKIGESFASPKFWQWSHQINMSEPTRYRLKNASQDPYFSIKYFIRANFVCISNKSVNK